MAKKQAATATAPVATPTQAVQELVNNGDVVIETPKKSIGSTEKLFPDLIPKEPENKPEPKVEKEEKQEEVSEVKTSEPEEYFLEDIIEKNKIPLEKLKSRIKVDGKEEVISFDEFKKRVQLKEHIDRAAQDIGRQRREFAEERKRIQSDQQTRNFRQNPEQSEIVNATPQIADKDLVIESLLNRIDALEQTTQRLNPVVEQTNRNRVAEELKAEGFDDFLDYLPKMEVYISKLTDPNQQMYFDTIDGAKNLYMKLKTKDLLEERASIKKTEVKAPVQERPAPPIVKMDSGQQPSTLSSSDIDDAQAKYAQTFKRWQETRSDDDFRQLLKLKGAIGK